jgi:hypothetical protein
MDHSPVRADRVGRWSVLILIALMALHGVQAARGLYGDGSLYLLRILHNGGFFIINSHRFFANVVTQTPVVLAMRCGVTDIAMLIRIQSLGLIVIPLGLWVGALVAQWRRPFFWALVVMFAVTQLNSGFSAIGEYNLAYALVVLSVALLLRPQALTRWQLVVLVVTAVLATMSYEALAYLGPVLLAIAAARIVGVRGVGAASSRAERATLIGLCVIYAVATAGAAWSILHPWDPANARNAADLWTPLNFDRQFIVATVIAVLAVAIPLIPARLRTPVTAAIAGSAAVIVLPRLWAVPSLHVSARTLTGLALCGLLVGAVVVQVVVARRDRTAAPQDRDATPVATTRVEWVAGLALLSAQLVPFTVYTAGFARWTAEVQHVVVTSSHPVIAVTDSGLEPQLTSYYSWWFNQMLSRVLSEQPCQGSLLPKEGAGNSLPGAPLPVPQSRFVNRSRLFPGVPDTQVAGAQSNRPQTNLVLDSHFEDTTIQHDLLLNGTRTTEEAHSGTHSWKMTQQRWYPTLSLVGKASDRSDYSKALRVRPGDIYYMEAWIYPEASNVGGGTLSFGAAVRDSTGQLQEDYPTAFSGNTTKGQWTKICGLIMIPTGYDLCWFNVTLQPDVPIGNVFYFDDIKIVRG